jgi:hypothetical protein
MRLLRVALVLAVLIMAAQATNALVIRTWVSGLGNDANPCSRTAPCKTFAGAFIKTTAGGEISVLDPGSYGTINITKALTISGDGTLAGMTVAALTTGLIVNAGVEDRVVIRNISFHGGGSGFNGVRYLAGKSLVLDNVTISGFTIRGIDMNLTNNGDLFVRNTRITKVPTGIFVASAAGLGRAALDRVHLEGLTNGIEGGANSRVSISNSIITGNASNGVLANSATTRIAVNGCEVSFNNIAGINAAISGSIIRLSNNDINNNIAGVTFVGGASVETAGNNRVSGNNGTTPLGAPTITVE